MMCIQENKGQLNTPAEHDINAPPAWVAGYSGEKVVICIVDDGVDHPHPELTDYYVSIFFEIFRNVALFLEQSPKTSKFSGDFRVTDLISVALFSHCLALFAKRNEGK